MFVIFFVLFILLFTIKLKLFIIILLLIIFIILLLIYNYINKITNKRIYYIVLISFLLSMLSMFVYNWFNQDKVIYEKQYIWTWLIVQDLSGKYEFLTNDWIKTILFAKNKFKINQKLFITAKAYKINYTWVLLSQIFEFNYNNYLFAKWYKYKLILSNSLYIWDNKSSYFQGIRVNINQLLSNSFSNKKHLWIILGMSIWDDSYLDEKIKQDFKFSWISHLLVVSWWNIVLVISFCSIILFFVPYYLRLILLLIISTFYVWICIWDASILRAYIMTLLWLMALFFGRIISLKRLLSYAMIFLLFLNPYYLLYDIWFMLSFGAVWWMIFLQYLIWENKLFFWKNYIISLIWPFIWTFPIIVIYFWMINFASILSNLLVSILISPIVIWSYLSIIFNHIWLWFFVKIQTMLIEILLFVSQVFAKYWFFIEIKTIYSRLFFVWIYGLIIVLFIWFKKYSNQSQPQLN